MVAIHRLVSSLPVRVLCDRMGDAGLNHVRRRVFHILGECPKHNAIT